MQYASFTVAVVCSFTSTIHTRRTLDASHLFCSLTINRILSFVYVAADQHCFRSSRQAAANEKKKRYQLNEIDDDDDDESVGSKIVCACVPSAAQPFVAPHVVYACVCACACVCPVYVCLCSYDARSFNYAHKFVKISV